ncbi:S1 family peptidase [Desulfovibrio falkowii]|uniref:Serine protease n=1 Tax=Desulfovibrio falkowii TaxID=3136602 RepID=A0ABQ0E8H2_9BACT
MVKPKKKKIRKNKKNHKSVSSPQREEARIGHIPIEQVVVKKAGEAVTYQDAGQAIFPLMKEARDGTMDLIGTAFFIHYQGIFVTAKHVLMDIYDQEKQEVTHGIFAIQILPDNHVVQRTLTDFTIHNGADVAIGRLHPMTHNKTGQFLTNNVVCLSFEPLKKGDSVITYAYPNTVVQQKEKDGEPNKAFLWPLFYGGVVVEEYPNGRDKVMLPNPCYQTSMTIHGGASGGPVFNAAGKVCGINSTGYPDMLDVSFISRINEILPLQANGICLSEGAEPTQVSVMQLIEIGQIKLDG